MTTLESVVGFIHGLSHSDLKISEGEYNQMVEKAKLEIESEKQEKEEAAKAELVDLLGINEDPPKPTE